jgi:hypothetical protein
MNELVVVDYLAEFLPGNCFRGVRAELGLDVERGRGVRGRRNDEFGMSNDEWRVLMAFARRFGSMEDAGGEIHGGFPTLLSIAFLPAVARYFWQRVFAAWGLLAFA